MVSNLVLFGTAGNLRHLAWGLLMCLEDSVPKALLGPGSSVRLPISGLRGLDAWVPGGLLWLVASAPGWDTLNPQNLYNISINTKIHTGTLKCGSLAETLTMVLMANCITLTLCSPELLPCNTVTLTMQRESPAVFLL